MAIMWHMMIEDAIDGWKAEGHYDLVRFDAKAPDGEALRWLLRQMEGGGNVCLPRAVAVALEALIRAAAPRVEVKREAVAHVPPIPLGVEDAAARPCPF